MMQVSSAGASSIKETIKRKDTNTEPIQIIRTENLEIHLSSTGANPVQWDIIGDPDSTEKVSLIPFVIFDNKLGNYLHVFLNENEKQPVEQFNRMTYRVTRRNSSDLFTVQFDSPITETGLQLTKIFRIPRKGFETNLTIILRNKGIKRRDAFLDEKDSLGVRWGPGMHLETKTENPHSKKSIKIVYKNSNGIKSFKFKKKEIIESLLSKDTKIDWIGLHSQYHMICIIPISVPKSKNSLLYGNIHLNHMLVEKKLIPEEDITDYPIIELNQTPIMLKQRESIVFSYDIFSGPKSKEVLKLSSHNLEKILFSNLYFWLRPLCFGIMAILNWLNTVVKSWGLAIIAMAVIVRIATFPITQYGIKQQKLFKEQQKELKPLIKDIELKYSGNSDQIYKETMRLYKSHHMSPFSSFKGCLWIIVQLPIFIALYQILSQSYELRNASFLWIQDLSKPEMLFHLGVSLPIIGSHFNFLPILMGSVQLVQGYFLISGDRPGKNTKNQKLIYLLPVTMTILFYSFASGLLLYWTVINLCQIFEHIFINKRKFI